MNLFSKGTVLAGAVAALFACGGGSSADQTSTTPAATEAPAAADPHAAPAADGDMGPASAEQVKCAGINECKGSAECAAADGSSSCKGQNTCKGKGWISASAEDCTAKGGTVVQ